MNGRWVALVLWALTPAWSEAADAPAVLRPYAIDEAQLRLSDGTLKKIYLARDGFGAAITSTDNGHTWSEPEKPVQRWANKVFLDRDGQMHGFLILLREGASGRKIAIDRFLDVWHFKTSGPEKKWEKGRMIQEGWNGSIVDNAVQMANGRIVQPSQDWVPGSRPGPPTGNGYAQMLYSDDGGETWKRSNKITSPVFPEFNGANFGACEPSVIIRDDGTLWSVMRTQTGFLYESSSKDGAQWSPGQASSLHSSTGPAALLKMPDRRLLIFWNNCEMPPKFEGKGVYAGRDALHAAISNDDGRTWKGFREVSLDPRRSLSPPKKGDRGVAYPYAFLSADGKRAEVSLGHGPGRVIVTVDPDWLLEKERKDDFSNGLENWSVFKAFGKAESWWRDRTAGAQLVDDAKHNGTKALHLRKPDDKDADGAVWNFPAGRSGQLDLRLKFPADHGGARIALADRFFEPTDQNAESKAIYILSIAPDGSLDHTDYKFPVDRWVDVVLKWGQQCEVLVEGQRVGTLPLQNPSVHGASYLHLRSTAAKPDQAGFFLGPVHVKVD